MIMANKRMKKFKKAVKKSIKKLKKDRNYFGVATDSDFKHDLRQSAWYKQRKERGFDETETWSLKTTIANFILPRLKCFRDAHSNLPEDTNYDSWVKMIDKMIFAFDYYANDKPLSLEEYKTVKEGMKLFAKYYEGLYW